VSLRRSARDAAAAIAEIARVESAQLLRKAAA
jgi:hypothetical protein